MKQKNILFIARWYPDKHDEMWGLFVQRHARAVSLYNRVTVLYLSYNNNLSKDKVEVEKSDFEGITEIRIYFKKHALGVVNLIRFIKFYQMGIRQAETTSGKFDLTHVHILSRSAFPALWMKYTRGIPFVITEHWSRYLPVNVKKGAYKGMLRKLFTKIAVSNSEAITTVTLNLAKAMQNLGLKGNYRITPNVADTTLFRPLDHRQQNQVKKLIHVSCFDEAAKNIKGIINVIQKLSLVRNDFVLELVGTGIDFEEIKEYADRTGLTGIRIFFTGLLTGEVLAAKMREADAMVMFSNYENLPCTIVESICSGVPVISTDVGGISEHLNHHNGILIPCGDEDALFSAIEAIFNEPYRFNPAVIRKYGVNHFSMESIGKLFDGIYRKACNKD